MTTKCDVDEKKKTIGMFWGSVDKGWQVTVGAILYLFYKPELFQSESLKI